MERGYGARQCRKSAHYLPSIDQPPFHGNFILFIMFMKVISQAQCSYYCKYLINAERNTNISKKKKLEGNKVTTHTARAPISYHILFPTVIFSRPVSVSSRPSAFVRPAMQAPPPMHRVAASPVKIYDTLM